MFERCIESNFKANHDSNYLKASRYRVAARYSFGSEYRCRDYGFRLALVVEAVPGLLSD